MASTYFDDIISNFDLNHLSSGETVQTLAPNFDKQKKSIQLLKTKIISTDFVIKEFVTKTEDYKQLVKTHSITKDELKVTCINYKNTLEKCTSLEKEQKLLLARQEMFLKRTEDAENKYGALISYTNQLQSLVKKLETEKEALIVEKQLDKSTSRVATLEKEKEALLKDNVTLKDIINGKKKKGKRRVKLTKQYENKNKLHVSDESADEMETCADILSHSKTDLNKIHKSADINITSNLEQHFIDDDSNSSNGEVSVDTGRGSSCANSDEKYLNSPDYFTPESSLKTSRDVIKQIDIGTSPITVLQSISVATSPIVFNHSLFEDLYDDSINNSTRLLDNPEHDIRQQTKLVDAANSPVISPDLRKFVDIGTSPIHDSNFIILEKDAKCVRKALFVDSFENKALNKETVSLKEQVSKCICQQSDATITKHKTKLADMCTSPIPKLTDNHKFVDKDTNTVNEGEGMNFAELNPLFHIEKQTSRSFSEKSTCTEIVTSTEKKSHADICTSPVLILHQLVDIGTSPIRHVDTKSKEQNKKKTRKSLFIDQEEIQTLKSLREEDILKASDNALKLTCAIQQSSTQEQLCLESDNGNNLPYEKSNDDKEIQKTKDNSLNLTCQTQQLKTQEQLCLESHNSNNLPYEKTNDTEIQDILNIMKFHQELISPILKTPSKAHNKDNILIMVNNSLMNVQKSLMELGGRFHSLESQVGDMKNQYNNVKDDVAVIQNIIKSDILNETDDTENINMCIQVEDIVMSELNIENEMNNRELQQKTNHIEHNAGFVQDAIVTTDKSNNQISDIAKDNKYTPTPVLSKPLSKVSFNGKTKEPDKLNYKVTPSCEIDNVVIISEAESNRKNSNSQQETSSHEINENFQNITSNIANTNDTEKSFVTNVSSVTATTKAKKISKLEKFRTKLIPTSKIKKIVPVPKHASKPLNIMLNNNTSTLLNHKIAYEKAVKVLAEERLNQIHEDNLKVKAPTNQITNSEILERRLSKIESRCNDLFDCNIISTRSRSSRTLNKKVDDNTEAVTPAKVVVTEECSRDVDKSIKNCKSRKRPADDDGDTLQGSCKRVLRSSNVSPANNKSDLTQIIINKASQFDHDYENRLINEAEEHEKNSNNLLVTNNAQDCAESKTVKDIKNLEEEIQIDQRVTAVNAPVAEPNSLSLIQNAVFDQTLDKSINGTQPQMELSKAVMLTANTAVAAFLKDNHIVEDVSKQPCSESIHEVSLTKIDHTKKSINDDRNLNIRNGSRFDVIQESQRVIEQDGNNETALTSKLKSIQDIAKSPKLMIKGLKFPVIKLIPIRDDEINNAKKNLVSYNDIDLYTTQTNLEGEQQNRPSGHIRHQKENILCAALERYGVISVKYIAKKVPDHITKTICQKIEESITTIIASPKDGQKSKMNELIDAIRNFNTKFILSGLMKYLKDPVRKYELLNTVQKGPAPPMTRSEVILLYVIENLNAISSSGDFVQRVWNNMEHALFQLNQSPNFDVIESMSHFYAVMCRYFRNKSRLRCFMLDAMYCLQFKAVPLIRQCLEVCPSVLPYAHERMAKTSLVTCLVYLLHFYKCQDKYNRAQDIRNILHRKYSYRFSEWNETMILEIFRKAIMNLRGTHNDKKMLRVALIILCKRHGAKWCQTNIIQNMLLPIIEKQDVPEKLKQFCVLMLGPLLKPFPADKRAQCESVINQLFQLLKQNPSHEMKEAIHGSLIFMSKHNQQRVIEALLSWNPDNISPGFEEILNDYVMEKPLSLWKKLVSNRPSPCT